MPIDHEERARKAWPYLVKVAKKELPSKFVGEGKITYGEISEKIGVHHRAARYFLGVIQKYCERRSNDLPRLQAVVVYKKRSRKEQIPGDGCYAIRQGEKKYGIELKKVHNYEKSGKKWPPKAPF